MSCDNVIVERNKQEWIDPQVRKTAKQTTVKSKGGSAAAVSVPL